jgi:hypothetical protein
VEHKECHLSVGSNLLKFAEADKNVFETIVMGDKTQVYDYIPEATQKSSP